MRMGCAAFLKQAHLPDLSGILEADFIVGKYMPAIVSGHFIQGLAASLGQDYGLGRLYGGKVIGIGLPPGADDVFVGFKHGMKR
jgi:hypothetical protein